MRQFMFVPVRDKEKEEWAQVETSSSKNTLIDDTRVFHDQQKSLHWCIHNYDFEIINCVSSVSSRSFDFYNNNLVTHPHNTIWRFLDQTLIP